MDEKNYLQYRTYDYYADNQKTFWNKIPDGEYTRLIQGKHREVPPMISVLLTTYKRVNYLKLALESALNQDGYNDYQVIVVDNEAAPIDEETETSQFMKQYANEEKVIYYRNIKSAVFRMDTAVSVAKSKWICFLHDDDMLAKDHLKIMSHIVTLFPQIRYLSTTVKNINKYYGTNEWKKEGLAGKYKLSRWPRSLSGKGQGWLGALIDRESFISIGGMPSINTGIGDFIMTGKFHYKYGIYKLHSGEPLYLYRTWDRQTTALDNWGHLYAVEYNYSIYDMEKYRKVFLDFWRRVCAYEIIEKCKQMNNSDVYNIREDIENVIKNSGMPYGVKASGMRHDLEWFLGRLCYYLLRKRRTKSWEVNSELIRNR